MNITTLIHAIYLEDQAAFDLCLNKLLEGKNLNEEFQYPEEMEEPGFYIPDYSIAEIKEYFFGISCGLMEVMCGGIPNNLAIPKELQTKINSLDGGVPFIQNLQCSICYVLYHQRQR